MYWLPLIGCLLVICLLKKSKIEKPYFSVAVNNIVNFIITHFNLKYLGCIKLAFALFDGKILYVLL